MARLTAGTAGAAVIHGAPGIGRSLLLRRGVAYARASGVEVLTAQGSAPQARSPYAFVRQLRPSLSSPGGSARAAGPSPGDGSVQGWARDLLSGTGRPTLLALDDVQWADPESVQVIRTLLRRLSSAPLAVVLTVTGARGEFPDSCSALVDQAAALQDGRGLVLELRPLDTSEVRALCTTAGPAAAGPTDDGWAETAELSHGNPWILRRAMDELRREPGEVPATGLPAARGRAITAALADRAAESSLRLAPEPLALLRGLAVCQGLIAVDQVATLVGLPETDLPRSLRELRVHHLIDNGDPPRPWTTRAASVLVGVDSTERKRLYVTAARWAHRCGADETELAALLLATVPMGDPWVPWVLRRTARALRTGGRYAEAAELLERALREPLDTTERAAVLLEAAEVYALTAPEAADRRIAEILEGPGTCPAVRTAAVDLMLARSEPQGGPGTMAGSYGPGDTAGAYGLGGTAGAYGLGGTAGAHGIGGTAGAHGIGGTAGAHGIGGTAGGYEVGGTRSPRGARDTGPGRLRSGGDHPAALADAAWLRAVRGDDADAVTDLARRVLDAPLEGALHPRLTACRVLAFADAHTEALRALDTTLAEAAGRGSPSQVGLGLMLRANLSLRAGDPDTAAHDLAACESVVPPAVWHPTRLTLLRAMQIRLLVAQERYDEAGQVAGEALPPGVELSAPWTYLLYARAQLSLCQGRPGPALGDAEECGRRLAAMGWVNPALLPWRSLAAVAHRACGEGPRSADLFAEELRLAERWGTDSALGWAELRRGLSLPGPHSTRPAERALRRLGPRARRFIRAVVARETAGLSGGSRTGNGHPPATA